MDIDNNIELDVEGGIAAGSDEDKYSQVASNNFSFDRRRNKVFLLYAEDDESDAKKFARYIESRNSSYRVQSLKEDGVPGATIIDNVTNLYRSSKLIFIFVTPRLNCDKNVKYYIETLLYQAIEDNKLFIPVITSAPCKMPVSLSSLRGLETYNLNGEQDDWFDQHLDALLF